MYHIVQRSQQQKGAIAAVEFEGALYDAGVSFFIGDLKPGQGPGLHRHPYSETCIIHSGRVEATIGGKVVVAGAGDIVVIKPETPHCFTAVGEERVVAVCIHASDRFTIDWLSEASKTLSDENGLAAIAGAATSSASGEAQRSSSGPSEPRSPAMEPCLSRPMP